MGIIEKLDRVELLLKHMPGRHDQQKHAGSRARFSVNVDPVTTNEQFAAGQMQKYLEHIPEHIQAESSMKSLEIYENPEDAAARIGELEGIYDEDLEYIRGAYDRDSGNAIVSLYMSEDQYVEGLGEYDGYSGRNFYHEFAHSLEDRITSDDWERAWGEWDYRQDEGFADAFSGYMVAKRSLAGGSSDEMDWFTTNRPVTTEVFKEWDL
jgi:hypothetical protein